MDKESALFIHQLKSWLKGYDDVWIQGAVTSQAIINTLDY
jgi:hypothetical protein